MVNSSRTVWDAIAERLRGHQIDHVFGMVGEGVGLLESAHANESLRAIAARDQRAAISMALGFSQASGRLSSFSGSAGPGIANALIGLLEAWSGNEPIIVFANAAGRDLRGGGAFQDFDAVTALGPVLKWAFRIEHEDRVLWAVDEAVRIAQNGRPGPVYVELPNDLVNTLPDVRSFYPIPRLRSSPAEDDIAAAAELLTSAERPVILVGGGCRRAAATREVSEVARVLDAAIFSTSSGRGVIDEAHRQFCGLAGLYISPPAEEIFEEADALLVVGSQVEETARIGLSQVLERSKIVQLDCDPETIGRTVPVSVPLLGDARLGLTALLRALTERVQPNRTEWGKTVARVRHDQRQLCDVSFADAPVRAAISVLRSVYDKPTTIVLDNGLQDMWAYFVPLLGSTADRHFVTPAEQTGLGLSVGAAIGAKIADPERDVVAIIGDGALLHGESSLWNAGGNGAGGLTYIVVNNGGFGWPRLSQTSTGREVGCRFDPPLDIAEIARRYKGVAFAPDDDASLVRSLEQAKSASREGKLALVEIRTEWTQDLPIGVLRNFV